MRNTTYSLQDNYGVCMYVCVAFTPNRPDIRARLMQLVDRELMDQMIVNRALHPARDLLPTLLFLLNSLEVHSRIAYVCMYVCGVFSVFVTCYFPHTIPPQSLQSPNRAESMKQYINDFTERFLLASESNSTTTSTTPSTTTATATTTTTTTTTTTPTGARKGGRISYAALLPEFFEKCQDFMEEIQRDVCNSTSICVCMYICIYVCIYIISFPWNADGELFHLCVGPDALPKWVRLSAAEVHAERPTPGAGAEYRSGCHVTARIIYIRMYNMYLIIGKYV